MRLPEAVRTIKLPEMVKIEQIFPDEHLDDVEMSVRNAVLPFAADMESGFQIRTGMLYRGSDVDGSRT